MSNLYLPFLINVFNKESVLARSPSKSGLTIKSTISSTFVLTTLLKAVLLCPAVTSAICCGDAPAASKFLWAADNDTCWLSVLAAPFNNWPISDLFSLVGSIFICFFSVIPKSLWNWTITSFLGLINFSFNVHNGTCEVLPCDLALLPFGFINGS